jgi:Alpha galactosidase A/Alpha galactosidase C-terminal beta sandwich domain
MWKSSAIDPPGNALTSVSCATASLCVAVDEAGNVLSSSSPGGEGASWQRKNIDANSLTGVSCPSATFCVAVDRAGGLLWSTNPGLGAAATWSVPADIDGSNRLTAVTCASESLCVAVDNAGNALASSDPSSPASWHVRAIDGVTVLNAVSCASGGPCAAVDASGNAFAGNDPAEAAPTWSSTEIDLGSLTGVSCAIDGPCVTVDQLGHALASDNPTAAPPTWSASSPEPGVALEGVSCVTAAFCATVDSAGRVLTAAISSTRAPVGTPAPSVAIVQPHPSIVGIPAVGERLRCLSGVSEESGASLAYSWWRDASPIAAANTSSYRVSTFDAQHHLQCQITATTAGGSASGHSAFVAIPAEGVLASVGETTIGPIKAGPRSVSVSVTCSTRATRGCDLALALSAVETVRAGRVVGISTHSTSSSAVGTRRVPVTLGASHGRLAMGSRTTLSVSLNATGRRLLGSLHRLPALLTVRGTVIGVLSAVLAQRRLALGGSKARAGRQATTSPVSEFPRTSRPYLGVPVSSASAIRASHPTRSARPSASPRTPVKAVLTPTPYMGWDTYFAFGGRYNEAMVLEQASELVALGLEKKGYRYVWLDAGWWQGNRNAHGEITINSTQWPHGLAWLTRTLHGAGLLAGIYTDAGRDGCGGAHQGSYNHYRQDANTFASWGFDAVKVDFCGGVRAHLDAKAAYSSFHGAIETNASHRPMMLSICNFLEPGQLAGGPPFEQSAFSSYTFGPSVGNSWRTDTDVGSPGYVTFATVLRNLDADAAHPEVAGPGHWNDPDYLGADQGLSSAQFDTQFSMWAMLAAPLMVSDNLTEATSGSVAALSNAEVIAIDQDPAGVQGTLLASSGNGEVWVKPLSDGSRAVALLNRGQTAQRIETSAVSAGMPALASYAVRDPWRHITTTTTGGIAAEVPGESTVLLRVSVSTKQRSQ